MTISTSDTAVLTEFEVESIMPGDRVCFDLPSSVMDLDNEAWAWVLEKKAPEGYLWAVIDDPTLVHQNPIFTHNGMVRIRRSDVSKMIPKRPESPMLQFILDTADESIVSIRRIDGKTAPVHIQIEQRDHVDVYKVTHQTWDIVR